MVPAGFDDQIPKLGSAPPSLVLRHGDSPSPLTARRKHHTTNLEGRSSHLLGQRHPHVSCAAVDPGNKWLVLIRFLAAPRGAVEDMSPAGAMNGGLDSSILRSWSRVLVLAQVRFQAGTFSRPSTGLCDFSPPRMWCVSARTAMRCRSAPIVSTSPRRWVNALSTRAA
jgi:hypothetical protein